MKPHVMYINQVEIRSDVENGMFVAAVENSYYGASTIMRLGGPAIKEAGVSVHSLENGEHHLEDFLIPVEGEPGLYDIEEGVAVQFTDPLDARALDVTSPRVRELWPAGASPEE